MNAPNVGMTISLAIPSKAIPTHGLAATVDPGGRMKMSRYFSRRGSQGRFVPECQRSDCQLIRKKSRQIDRSVWIMIS